MHLLEKAGAILVGSLLLGIGVNFFLSPYHLLDGGMIGIGLLIHYYFDFPTGLSMIFMSIPLYIYAWYYQRKLFIQSLHGLLISSLCVDWLSGFQISWDIPVYINAILGGTFIGLGIGLMLRYETTTGGTDLLAKIIANKLSINPGIIIFGIDVCIILSGIGIVGITTFLYSGLTILFVAILTSITVKETV